MPTWTFHPIKATKEAYEQKPFEYAKDIRHMLGLMSTTSHHICGQIVLVGTMELYPTEWWVNGHASLDQTRVYICFKNINQLKDILNTLEYKEEKIERIFLYNCGFFRK